MWFTVSLLYTCEVKVTLMFIFSKLIYKTEFVKNYVNQKTNHFIHEEIYLLLHRNKHKYKQYYQSDSKNCHVRY